MVIVAQSVRAPDCGSGGRGFESRLSPKVFTVSNFFEKEQQGYLKFVKVSYLCALVLKMVCSLQSGCSAKFKVYMAPSTSG